MQDCYDYRQTDVADYPPNTQLQPLAALHKWHVQQGIHNPSVSHKITFH